MLYELKGHSFGQMKSVIYSFLSHSIVLRAQWAGVESYWNAQFRSEKCLWGKDEFFQQNLVLVILFINFDTKFHKKTREFHYLLRSITTPWRTLDELISEQLFPANLQWHFVKRSVIFFIEFLLNWEWCLARPKIYVMHAINEALQ